MKKIFIFIFVLVVAFSCVVLPFASADTVIGGGTANLPYQFNGQFDFIGVTLGSYISLATDFDTPLMFNVVGFLKNLDYTVTKSNDNRTVFTVSTGGNSGSYFGWDNIPTTIANNPYVVDFVSMDGVILSFKNFRRSNNADSLGNSIYFSTQKERYIMEFDIVYDTNSVNPDLQSMYLNVWIDTNSNDFNCNVVTIDFTYSNDNNIIRLTDVNGNYVRILFQPITPTFQTYWDTVYNAGYYWLKSFVSLSNNTYFVQDITQITDDERYQFGYNDGFSAGEDFGYDTGYDIGFGRGKNEGDIIGYNRGYSEGISSAGNYTFTGLISAVFDAPIKAFRGLLDFNLLGVDMAQFAFSLFSLSLIIVVIRFMLAR